MPKSTLKKKISTRLWWGLLCKLLLFLCLVFLPDSYAFAQIEPNPPVFNSVSINPENNDVMVRWFISPTPEVVGYGIQEEDPPGENKFVHIVSGRNTTNASFSYPKVLTGPVKFNIDAYVTGTNRSVRTEPSHQTMFASLEFDSCNTTIRIKWTPYVGWEDTLLRYDIMEYAGSFNYVQRNNEVLGPGTSEYVVSENIQENTTYCFFVSAIRKDGMASYSNKVCITTTTPASPAYMLGDFTRFSGTNQLNIHFSIDPSVVKDSYSLYRSDPSKDQYEAIADINKSADGTVSYTDNLPSLNVYNYYLTYVNQCNIEGNSSIPINNIVLKGRSSAMTNHLTWNKFSSWPNGINEVNIYRGNSQGGMEQIASLSGDDTEFSDVIAPESQMRGDVCYQVQAVSSPDQNGKINISESNIFCVDMLGDIFVPNAFTPNDDGLNDFIKPSFSIIPENYIFIVYNRYGSKIFETSNISEGWDGRLSDGGRALEGAYIYFVKIENKDGKVLEKRGNFTVIYP